MSVNSAVQDDPIVSHDSARKVINRLLHIAVHVEKRFTVDQIASETGVGKSAVSSYLRNEATREPSLSNALSIAVVLGPKAVNAIMALVGYSASPLDDADALQAGEVVAKGMAHLTVIANAAADGRIDHMEAPSCQQAADEIIAAVLPLSSAGKAA